MTVINIPNKIAEEIKVGVPQVQAAVALFDEGATVPFVARYRKEVTGGLDDTQLRDIHARVKYLRELVERQDVIIKSIESQGKLTEELQQSILLADTKARLEDLYKPYKSKRRTRGQIAIEAGLQQLATDLLNQRSLIPEQEAIKYLNAEKNILDVKTALEGAKYILMEQFAENADLLAKLRIELWERGYVKSTVVEEKKAKGQKFADYFDYRENIKKVPPHRVLAVLRGRNEGYLQLAIEIEDSLEPEIIQHFSLHNTGANADNWLQEVVKWTWQIKLRIQLEIELITKMREIAEAGAIKVFASNLRDLLMASPAGSKITMGLDPGLRTGVKIAVVDSTGKLLNHATIFPHVPKKQWDQSLVVLLELCQKYKVDLISIGNGTGSRETDQLVHELLEKNKNLNCCKIIVSEAGASVYSASEYAAKEFPDLDVTFRGAVSIARRLQDPLAELVKIEAKSIGVGLYQHDVSNQLTEVLDDVVEDCVNAVGVDLNTASLPLLAKVAGLNKSIASNIITFRDEYGEFKNRSQLQQVPKLGAKAYQQAAGFLRVRNGDNILDTSGVHPEAYSVVEKMANKLNKPVAELVRNFAVLKTIQAEEYIDDKFGLPTVIDIISELEKPGRDPRPEFKTAIFKEDIKSIDDLSEGMLLEGVVTNVSSFGVFIDIGVHQDGLAHISELANRFVADPRDVVKTGQIVQVRILGIDKSRKRINLSLRLNDEKKQTTTVAAKPLNKSQPKNDNFSESEKLIAKKSNGKRHEHIDKSSGHKQQSSSLFGNMLSAALKTKG